MPSYKPMPKMSAAETTHVRSATTQEYSSPLHNKFETEEKKKIVISKDQIKYSRNKGSIDLKVNTQDNALNTYQPNVRPIHSAKVETTPKVSNVVREYNTKSSSAKVTEKPKQFEYQSPQYRYDPVDLDTSNASISSIFIAPSKGAKQNMDRLVKIKEKILNPGSDMSHEVDFSSSHFTQSITGTRVMKDSMASLSMEQGSDEEDNYAPKAYSKEVYYNSAKPVQTKNQNMPKTKSRERFEYHPAREEVYNPVETDSMSITRPGIQNMVISDHLKAVIEEEKKQVHTPQDLNDFVNSNTNIASQDQYDPNKNMINLENILIIEKKIGEILQEINTMVQIDSLCEDWWEVTQEETMLMNLGNVFKEPKFKAILKQATLCECATISIVYVISLHLETPPTIILTLLRNMLLYVHQNFLVFIKLILTRLPQESRDNVWAHSLQMLIEEKGFKKKKKNELFAILSHNLAQLIKITQKI